MTEELHAYGQSPRHRSGWLRWFLVLGILAIVLFFYVPTPYYVTRPGSAVVLAPLVEVEGGKKEAEGQFMLTTVRMGEANPAWYLYARLSPDAELIDKRLVLSHGETDEDFTRRELKVMQTSQEVAEAVAFRKAGYEVNIDKRGVLVMGTIAGMPAREKLQVGDVIVRLDQLKVNDTKAMLNYLADKNAGEQVSVTFLRNGKEQTVSLKLAALPGEPPRPGLGIRPEDNQVIEVPQEVKITSQGIGGPSAGLMFTLEIYDQLKQEIDLTRGYKVAGTGTIDIDGTVGRIGGIHQKVVAADKAGAEIFFAPDDGAERSNYEEAVDTAERIGTRMRIVPVKHVDDAIRFLTDLAPKQS